MGASCSVPLTWDRSTFCDCRKTGTVATTRALSQAATPLYDDYQGMSKSKKQAMTNTQLRSLIAELCLVRNVNVPANLAKLTKAELQQYVFGAVVDVENAR